MRYQDVVALLSLVIGSIMVVGGIHLMLPSEAGMVVGSVAFLVGAMSVSLSLAYL